MTDIKTTLLKLADTIYRIVTDAKEKKIIEPEDEVFFQWKLRDFQYTDAGIVNTGADGSYVTKKTWFKAYGFVEKEVSDHLDLSVR